MGTIQYIWNMENDSYLMEKDDIGVTSVTYTSEPVAYGKLISQCTDNASYYHFDQQSSTRQLTDQNENVSNIYEYAAFGDHISSLGVTDNPYQYNGGSGYYWDEETTSYYVRARHYRPNIARWLSTDPIGLMENTNLYSYCLNAPTNLSDAPGTRPQRGDPVVVCGQFAPLIWVCTGVNGCPVNDIYFIDALFSLIRVYSCDDFLRMINCYRQSQLVA